MSLFERAILFTDIHHGNKSNSLVFNQDCSDFVDWVCEVAKERNINTCIFLGDWNHNRASINIATLNYSTQNLEKLNSTFDTVHMFPGNHDEYYRDRRDYNSIPFVNKFKNVQFYNDITTVDGCTFVPWLVGDEYKRMPKLQSQYVFGHFELPHFYMNAMVQMPDHGEVKSDDFKNCGTVFSGHFHKRQEKDNVAYIGNAFGHNYSDAWDDERGIAILEWGKPHEYLAWPDAPKYKVIKISQLLDGPEHYLKPKTYARIVLDIDISYEEANFIKETFIGQYALRELAIIPNKNANSLDNETVGDINFESVDTIVSSQLSQVDSNSYDRNLLMDIYRTL
jgi:hypothetical protein